MPETDRFTPAKDTRYPPFRVDRVAQSVKRLSYGLDGLGSNAGGEEIFRQSRPALAPTQPPVQRIAGLSWG